MKSQRSGLLPAQTDGYPHCRMCRDGTYATLSLQISLEDDWTHYCEVCGQAMASVIRDCYQQRDPEIRRLPTPPAKAAYKPPEPVKKPDAPKPPEPVKKPDAPKPLASKLVSSKSSVIMAAREVEEGIEGGIEEEASGSDKAEYDLLALLGWKK